MEKEVDIVALGELLIDFTEAGYGKDGMKLFEQNPGGAPANLLTVASHTGHRLLEKSEKTCMVHF